MRVKPPTRQATSSPPALSPRANRNGPLSLACILIVLAVGTLYIPMLGIPFLGDDYIFLEKTRLAGFADLWSRSNTDFGWYRPWSREFFFWTIQHLAGPNPSVFRATNLVLWIASLFIFGKVVQRLADSRTAVIAIAGVATLGLWGTPLLWISGSQDLWMFFFLSLALLAIAVGRDRWALVPYVGALLSKETAAVFPLFAVGVWWVVQRRRIGDMAGRLAPIAAVTLLWLAVHPVLVQRFVHGRVIVPGAEQPVPAWGVALKTALSMVNADQLGDVLMPPPGSALTAGIATVLLAIAMWLAAGHGGHETRVGRPHTTMLLGACWALAGWLPLFLPSISWHAYYGCIGATGAWVALAAWLGRRKWLLVAVTLLLGTLRIFNTSSRAWDWGSEWYQRRAGSIIGTIQKQLMERYPTLPPHSRVFFGSIPNNIGLVAGSSPAVRVWYRDSTLRSGFYSYYRPRSAPEPSGPDLFFHFDSTRGLQEVRLGPEDVARAAQAEPNWEVNHEALAMTFLRSGDCSRAADEFEKIAELPTRADADMFAAMCREASGDSLRARRLMLQVGGRTGGSRAEIAAWAQRLRATMPRGQMNALTDRPFR